MQNIMEDDEEKTITLYLESMLTETPKKIKERVTTFNQMIDECVKHGQQY